MENVTSTYGGSVRQQATVETMKSEILSMSIHMVLQIVDLVKQQATVVIVKSETSSTM